MSDTAVAAKPAKTAVPPVAPTPVREQKLREAQIKKFGPSSLQAIGHDFELLAIKVPAEWTVEDLLNPGAWANVASIVARDALNTRRDKIGSLIYARSETGAFKMLLSIEAITVDRFGQANGLRVEPWLK
jgi:hypothetical protein